MANWDGKTRPVNETYRANYNDIFNSQENHTNMNIRLMFEPNPGVKCNVDKMFKYYAENYLSDFPEFEFGGYIMLNTLEHKYTKSLSGEPFYQFIAVNVSQQILDKIAQYIKTNPIEGYYTHIHFKQNGENEKALPQ